MNKILENSFLVGGAVRDTLLGLTPKDRDFVVVGCTPHEMNGAGFKRVGNDFPVFLHPETGEEYALARTERKVGSGHTGFTTVFDPSITLEDDLRRRDLTVNSMAIDGNGQLVDPFGGAQDLKDRVLRHTSEAFVEDPLRVLRVARFAAQLGFSIAPKTFVLMFTLAQTQEFKDLTVERVFLELEKSLKTDKPSNFFLALKCANALHHFPEVHALVGQTQPPQWHPEGDSFEHTLQVLDQSVNFSDDPMVRFCALVHDFGKGLTKKEDLPKHKGHEAAGVPVVEEFCDRLKVPSVWKKHARIATEFHMHVHKTQILNPKTFVNVFEKTNAARDFSVIDTLVKVSKADVRGRGVQSQSDPLDNQDKFLAIMEEVRKVKFSDLSFKSENPTPENIKQAFRSARIKKVKEFLKGYHK